MTTKSEGKDAEQITYEVDLTFSGTMEGLVENHPYRVIVIGSEDGKTKTYCSQDLNTTEKQTEIRGFSGECTCSKDGNYTFSLDYTDENGYYSDFSYELLSPSGETVKKKNLDSLKGKIVIPNVDELDGEDYTLVIRFQYSSPVDLDSNNVKTDLGGGLSILQHHGSITITQHITI